MAITLPQMRIHMAELQIVGLSPLISHAWSEKSKKEMLDKQMKKAKTAKKAKDPCQDYAESMYWISKRPKGKIKDTDIAKATFGFPAVAFKSAAVTACSQVDGITKVFARGAFHVNLGEELVVIESDEPPVMREDMVRIAMGTADLRYRGSFENWKTTLKISYNDSAISLEQIANLFNTAGFSVGIGEWRPEKDGQFGMFELGSGL